MAITQVGTAVTNLAASGVTAITVNLPTGVAENDVAYGIVMSSQLSDVTCSESSGTWAKLADLYANGSTNDTNFAVFRKVQGASPDASITMTARVTNGGILGICFALRGVDTTTPEDAVVATDTATGATSPNPPEVTSVTNGAWILALAGASDPDVVSNGPTGYTFIESVEQTVRNAMAAYLEKATAGAEDPGAFTDVTSDADDSWCAATIAVRPASSGPTYELAADAASYAYTATAAGLEHDRLLDAAAASYTWTATAAGLEHDRQLVADSAAYAWNAADADIEYGATYELAADSAAYLWSADDATLTYTPIASGTQPTGGSSDWADFHRAQAELRRRRREERERLRIGKPEQRAIDRAAVKIAATLPEGGLRAAPAIVATPAFDRLLSIVQPTEGQVMALVQAILDRLAWMAVEEAEDQEVFRLMMEMD